MSFSWNADNAVINGTPAAPGVYNYSVTLTGGCGNIVATGRITVNTDNTISLTSAAGTDDQTLCISTPLTSITYVTTVATGATFTGLPAGVTGTFAGGVVTISGIPSESGTFIYTVDLTGGCGSVSAVGRITVRPDNTISLTSAIGTDAQVICKESPITDITWVTTGADGATFSGLPAGISGIWASDVVTVSGTPSVTGTFNYIVTLTGGCGNVTATGTIVINEIPVVLTTDPVPVCAPSTADLTAASVIAGSTPGLVFTYWTDAAATVEYLTPATAVAGTYYIKGTDLAGCYDIKPVTVVVNTPPAGSVAVTDVLCFGESTGGLDLSVTGGLAPYTFVWSNGSTDEDLTGVIAGNYSVTITDANGCSTNVSETISEPATPLAGTTVVNDATCLGGGTDGAIDLTVTGGVPPYNILWSNGATTEDLVALTGGTYTATITDANGCMEIVSATVVDLSVISGDFAITNVSCFGGSNGALDLTVNGGTAPFTYNWSNGETTQDISGLAPGTYIVIITDAFGCTGTATADITEPSAPLSAATAITDVACFGGSTGAVDLTVSGGTAPYAFVWSNSATTEDISGLSAGTYTVAITDANGCAEAASVTVTEPATALTGTASATDVLCYGSANGAVSTTVSGGQAPYFYLWSNGETTANITGVAGGAYSVTVTDALGCEIILTADVDEPEELLVTEVHTDASCPGIVDGSITLTVDGGTAPYAIYWSDGVTTATRPATDTIYSVIVTDANGCFASLDITVGFSNGSTCIAAPKVITPNDDGKNDKWIIKNIELYPDAEVLIYNRWGQLVYRTKNISANPWDGREKGKLVPADSYYYILYINDGTQPRSGTITVVR
jgi:gliding motility-associated-like protein